MVEISFNSRVRGGRDAKLYDAKKYDTVSTHASAGDATELLERRLI